MRKIESAHAGTGPHRKGLRESHAGMRFDIQQPPNRPFLRVVRAGRIPGRRSDSPIFLLNQVFIAQMLGATVAPLPASSLVKALRESFGKPIGDRLSHDGAVVVVPGAKAVT